MKIKLVLIVFALIVIFSSCYYTKNENTVCNGTSLEYKLAKKSLLLIKKNNFAAFKKLIDKDVISKIHPTELKLILMI